MHKHPTCLKRKIKVMIQMQILKCTLQNQIVVYKEGLLTEAQKKVLIKTKNVNHTKVTS